MTEKDALLLVLGIRFWMLERRIERREKAAGSRRESP